MALSLMYITNRPQVARIAQQNGVDRIFVDMEYVGKELRQPGDTVKSHHTVADVKAVRSVVDTSQILVRVNPIGDADGEFVGSKREIDATVAAGADLIMLPMARTVEEIERFVDYVDGRARTVFLLETAQAAENAFEMASVDGIDEIHIGLNDLHLSYKNKFMFELLANGRVEELCHTLGQTGKPYGFGGIARLGYGMLPSEYVIAEHYRLGSSAAILSRSFCNIRDITDYDEIGRLFECETKKLREYEDRVAKYSEAEYEQNRSQVVELVGKICEKIGG